MCLGQVTMRFSCPLVDGDTADWTRNWALGPQWSNQSVQAFAAGWVRPGQALNGLRGAHLDQASGDFDVHCKVCGVKYDLVDADSRPTFAKVDLTWGPNTYEGQFNESLIKSYAIFQVDADSGQVCSVGDGQHADGLKHVDLQQALMEVPKRASGDARAPDGAASHCMCPTELYSAEVSWQMPSGVSEVRLMVSPVTTAGEVLPLGVTTGVVTDVSTAKPVARVTGSMTLTVANASAFISDPKAKQGIANSIAQTAGVPSQFVTVTLSIARRLRGVYDMDDERRLSSGVKVDFSIDIPEGSTVSADTVHNNVANTQPEAFKAIVNNQLSALGSQQAIESVSPIVASQVSLTPAPTPAPVPSTPAPPPKSRGTPVVEEEDDTPVAGIVVGVLVGICCLCGVVGVGIWYYAQQSGMTVGQLLGGGQAGSEVSPMAVMPQPQVQPGQPGEQGRWADGRPAPPGTPPVVPGIVDE